MLKIDRKKSLTTRENSCFVEMTDDYVIIDETKLTDAELKNVMHYLEDLGFNKLINEKIDALEALVNKPTTLDQIKSFLRLS